MVITLTYPTRLLLAILGDLSLYIIGTNIAWALQKPKPGRLGQVVECIKLWGARLWLGELLRLAYYLVPPYLVLYYGWASPLDLGLADLDWIRGIGWSVAWGGGSLLLLLLLWWQYTRLIRHPPRMQDAQWLAQPWGWAFILREAILMESWWALCRSPMLLLTGPYFGVYLGLVIVSVAALLNAHIWYALSTPGLREEVVLAASLAVVTATLYAFIHNVWLCVAVHFIMRMAIQHLIRAGRRPDDLSSEQFGV